MSNLFQSAAENLVFVLEFLGIIAALFVAALFIEKLEQKMRGRSGALLNTYKMAVIGMLSALAAVLMILEFPVFFAPFFYGLDFSELPILIGAFAFGPAAGVLMEFIKILLKLMIKPTSTAFVGELANFAVGCSFIIPASTIYLFKKTRKSAILSCVIGTAVLTVFGTAFNVVYLIPAFAKMFHMPMESIMEMFREALRAALGLVNMPLHTFFQTEISTDFLTREGSLVKLVAGSVAPLNLIKGAADSIVAIMIYKPLSPYLKNGLTKK